MRHEECKYCPYWFEGHCMVRTWLDPLEQSARDINECLDEAYANDATDIWGWSINE